MIHRKLVLSVAALSALCSLTAPSLWAKELSPRPNILFILADDQGWADLDQSLDPEHPEAASSLFNTPNIDRLAERSTVFTDAYSPAPICTPTRRSIQYGMTPARLHGTEFLSEFTGEGLFSVAQYIKQADPSYACAIFGKWGEAMSGRTWAESNRSVYPKALGYDESDGRGTGNETGGFYHPKDGWDVFAKNYNVEAKDDPKLTFSVTKRSIDFMKRQSEAGRPFYLQVNYYAIHTAFQARQETIAKYAGKQADRQMQPGVAPMLEDLDAAVGLLLQAVKDLGLADNTYIFYASDNGGEKSYIPLPAGSGKLPARNAPLRNVKGSLYEGGIRVPLIVSGPGLPEEVICREPVALYDLLPTFYQLAGGTKPLPDTIDGVSLMPVLEEGEAIERTASPGLVFHRPQWKEQSVSTLRQGDYKLVVTWAGPWKIGKAELFDLSRDIGEQKNLAVSMPDKVSEMEAALLAYLRAVDAEVVSKDNS